MPANASNFCNFPLMSLWASPMKMTFFSFLKIFYSFIHMCIHIWAIPPPSPHLLSLLILPHFKAEPVLPLSLSLLKRRHSNNKEDKAFLR
jgi:hypothetical protein